MPIKSKVYCNSFGIGVYLRRTIVLYQKKKKKKATQMSNKEGKYKVFLQFAWKFFVLLLYTSSRLSNLLYFLLYGFLLSSSFAKEILANDKTEHRKHRPFSTLLKCLNVCLQCHVYSYFCL